MAELQKLRDDALAEAEMAEREPGDGTGPKIAPDKLRSFTVATRRKLRMQDGTYRREYVRAFAQRVEIDGRIVRIMGNKTALLKSIAAGVETAALGVPSFVPKWRAGGDKSANTWEAEAWLCLTGGRQRRD